MWPSSPASRGFASSLPASVRAAGTTPAEAFAAAARTGTQARTAVAVGYRVTAGVLLALTVVVVTGMRRTHAGKVPQG
jgi:hypothetical protein